MHKNVSRSCFQTKESNIKVDQTIGSYDAYLKQPPKRQATRDTDAIREETVIIDGFPTFVVRNDGRDTSTTTPV